MKVSLLILLAALVVPADASSGEAAAPETRITSGPARFANTSSATFAFTSDQPSARFACALDSGAFFSCTSPYSLTVRDGKHHFEVVAIASGTTDPSPAAWTWEVDTVAPKAVSGRLNVGYGRVAIRWGRLGAIGADRIVVTRSTEPRKQPTRVVYRGAGSGYVDPRYKNGLYHRYRIVASDRAGNVSPAVDAVVAASALLLAPTDGARLRAPTTLRWRRIRTATFYNVQLYRGGQKVLSAWPRSPRFRLDRSWNYRGHRFRLKRGRYTWYVWPGFGLLASGRYGQMLGQSSFTV
jgi:hypothetical protein